MFSFAHAYAYLLFAESRPASPAATDPLDSLLTRLISAPIEALASRGHHGNDAVAVAAAAPLRALPGGRGARAADASVSETLRPAA